MHDEREFKKSEDRSLLPFKHENTLEEHLARDILSDSADTIIKGCEGIVKVAKNQGDIEALAPLVTPRLLNLMITTLNKQVRYASVVAFLAIEPSLEVPAIKFADSLEREISKKIFQTGRALYAGNYDWQNFPWAEQVLIAGEIACNTLMKAHFSGMTSHTQEDVKFATMIIEQGLSQLKILESMDDLSSYRPLLPLNLRALQDNLYALRNEGILSKDVYIVKQIKNRHSSTDRANRSEKSSNAPGFAPPELDVRIRESLAKQVGYSDALCKELSTAESFNRAAQIIIALGEVGDMRAVQALKQAQMGSVSRIGYVLEFENDEHNDHIKKLCQNSISKITNRFENRI